MRTYTRYNNAGRTKIYDDAMAWVLLGFLDAPLWGLYYAARALAAGHGRREIVYCLTEPWRHQLRVWRGL